MASWASFLVCISKKFVLAPQNQAFRGFCLYVMPGLEGRNKTIMPRTAAEHPISKPTLLHAELREDRLQKPFLPGLEASSVIVIELARRSTCSKFRQG